MKWMNKGHELDGFGEKLVQMFQKKQKKIYIFGAGLLGGELVKTLEKYKCFAGYIDNDLSKQVLGIDGRTVISLEQYIDNGGNGFIVIAANEKNIPAIEGQLGSKGLIRGEDYWRYTEFIGYIFPILSLYEFDLLYVDTAQICVTERCSLKCKDCAHGCFAVDTHSQDMSIEMAKESADVFFSKVDYVREFVLIGGEPFLYANLSKIIEYIGKKYRDRINIFSITTNGTIIPKTNILKLCSKYEILIRISNYSQAIKSLEMKYQQLINQLEKAYVSYILGDKEWKWVDYGFRTVDRKWNSDELIQVFDNCRTLCREIRGNKYYYCVMARSISTNLKFGVGKDDYLDLNDIDERDKKIILEFQVGYSDKGYLDMCNHCNGGDAVNYPIPAAEQFRKQ
ncbi:radical SAM protein [Parablautia muri]|uniref:4Fe-4S cluster-binding domain-containing protein n=1 Tax=Parablautia muri TaxID=2320879 RepID=A0A9X5GRU3_9FIRM|nr:radical SAM protein [Parablautia muri]NBJ92531.1 4Fe-4S cluster-binding domain-containing protein [Parablautia muri]